MMSAKRSASEQVAFRIEPELASKWANFAADSLVPNRAHLICAMLMYMTASARQRDRVQRAYARFQRSGVLEDMPTTDIASLSEDEATLLEAFRQAPAAARDEAIVNLQDASSASVSRNADIA